MISSAAIVEHLAALKPDPYRFIGKASDFVAASGQLIAGPSLYVLPSAKRAGPDRALTGVISQRIVAQFSLVIGVLRAGPKGGDQLDAIETLEQALIDALVGWQPDGVTDPVTYVGGRMVGIDIDKGIMFWGSDFAAGYYLRK